jgi:hypothetical protein
MRREESDDEVQVPKPVTMRSDEKIYTYEMKTT